MRLSLNREVSSEVPRVSWRCCCQPSYRKTTRSAKTEEFHWLSDENFSVEPLNRALGPREGPYHTLTPHQALGQRTSPEWLTPSMGSGWDSLLPAEPSTQAGLAKQRLPVRGPDRYPQPGNCSPRIIEPLLSFTITKGASPDFSVRRGKAPSSNGCETRPTTVAPVGSSQGGWWKRRPLRDLGKFSEFSTFPPPRRRRLFSGSRPPLRRPPRLWPGSTAGHSRVKRPATVNPSLTRLPITRLLSTGYKGRNAQVALQTG